MSEPRQLRVPMVCRLGRRCWGNRPATGITVLSLVTGATRSWTIPSADGYANGLSWAGDRYLAFQFERTLGGGITGVFNPVITPDGSTIVAAAWTGFLVAELAEFSARTGRLLAVLMPAAHMPGHGSPCQALWADPSGAHLIAYCDDTAGVVNGTHFTPVHLHIPDTSGTDHSGLLW